MSYEALGRLPDPVTNPAGPGFVTQQLVDNTPGMQHPLNNGGSVGIIFAGQYWEINIGYPQLTPSEMSALMPFLYSLRGGFTNFYIQLPTYVNPQTGAWTTSTDALVAKNSITLVNPNTISIPSWSLRGGDVSVGDMLKFSNMPKIYMVTETSLDLGDVKTITLNADVAWDYLIPTASLEMNDIKFKVRLKGAAPSPSLTADGLYEAFSLSLRENAIIT